MTPFSFSMTHVFGILDLFPYLIYIQLSSFVRSYRHINQSYLYDRGYKYGNVVSSGMVVSLESLEDVCQCTNTKITAKYIERINKNIM